jgi:hypothetical protein
VPATRLGELVERRAAAARSAHPVAHLRYPGAGHAGVGVPGTPAPTEVRHPVDGASYALGGMPAANAAARADSWPRVLAFLAAAGSWQGRHRAENPRVADVPELTPHTAVPVLPSWIVEPLWDQFRALLPNRPDTHPLGCHRDEWIAAGAVDALHQLALDAYDRMLGLDLDHLAVGLRGAGQDGLTRGSSRA